ncbi:hypothetical protein AAFF_G00238540 [Aldrovandia affinis]|uniref:Mesoderm induction early response protein 2 n=1 Tax=Aldrovandia affinis TaxID=143900 RepID=A0AAD7RDZ1_9TELE|nr:hypothetical protein AAFF_G00238540 [Aldrovandia affinis]
MGSGERSFTLAEILARGYGLQEEEEDSPQRAKTLEDLEQSLGATRAGEMPLEELLALYGYEVSDRISGDSSEATELPAHLPDVTLDKDRMVKDLLSGEEEESPPDDLTSSVTSHASDLFRRHLRAPVPVGEDRDTSGSSSDEDSEGRSAASNEGRKDIMVGLQYQAVIPPLNPSSYQERAYENEDQLLWAPAVEPISPPAYERTRTSWGWGPAVDELGASGDIIRDSEQALYELVKCSFNTEEALRRLRFNVKVFRVKRSPVFEHGWSCSRAAPSCSYGKNFHLIQANKVRTRSVGECVEYYYLWKKSDRHEYFTLQTTRLGRRKYNLQTETMEDGEQDGEGGSPPGPETASQLNPPPPRGTRPEPGTASCRCRAQRRGVRGEGQCPRPPAPELLGPGFYQLQLGPFGSDGPFTLPAVAPPSPSAFGAIGGFLCPPPVQHPRFLTQ